MQDYEYKDEGGRFLCKLHHKLRCDECHYVSDLRDENKRYRKALRFYADRTHYELSREAEEADLIEFINDMDRDEGYIARKALEQSE